MKAATVLLNAQRRSVKGKRAKHKVKPKVAARPTPQTVRLDIGNLTDYTTTADVERFFPEATKVDLMFEDGSQRCKGFGFVEFETKKAVEKALRKNGHALYGRCVCLKLKEENVRLPFNQGHVILARNFSIPKKLSKIRRRLRRRFKQCGLLKEVFLPENLIKKNKGTAFIEFADENGLNMAFQPSYAAPFPGDSELLEIFVPRFEDVPFLCLTGGGRGGNCGYNDDRTLGPVRNKLPVGYGKITKFDSDDDDGSACAGDDP